jgi:hypothetical protein
MNKSLLIAVALVMSALLSSWQTVGAEDMNNMKRHEHDDEARDD